MQSSFRKSVDGSEGIVTLPGLSGEARIRRDALGVPFVEAASEDDLFYAFGYASASDRLWQMVLMKMVTQGRLSEIVGKDSVPIDIFMRSLGMRTFVERAIADMDAPTRRVLECYARGVNAYIAAHENLPAEFRLTGYRPEEWKPEDSFYVFAMLNLSVSFNFLEELNFLVLAQRIGYEKAAWLVPVYPDEALPFDEAKKLESIPAKELCAAGGGWGELREKLRGVLPMGIPASNNWALAGSRTKSGKSIIENDTHLELLMPNAWMMAHLKCPTYEAAGVMVPGIPIVNLGFNGKVAWGATMVMADSQDIFVEKLKKEGERIFYLYKGEWRAADERVEQIRVNGKDTVTVRIRSTVHGPLLNDALAQMPFPPALPIQPVPLVSSFGLAFSWAVEEGARTFAGFYRLGKAGSAAEARQAIADIKCIYLNFVFGDKDTIAWQVSGKFPTRKKGRGLLPSPGWDGEYDWNGFVPFEKHPYSMNPAEGYLVTANNRTVEKNFPVTLSSSWYHPDRADRLKEVLSGMKAATADDMFKLQFERYSLMARKLQKMLFESSGSANIRRAAEEIPEKKRRARALEALDILSPGKFNCVMDAGSARAAVMGSFMHEATRAIFLDELGPADGITWQAFMDINVSSYSAPEDHLLGRADSPFWDYAGTETREGSAQIIARALAASIELCEDRMGSDRASWTWGALHTYHWRHDFTRSTMFFHGYLNRGPYPAGGDVHSVNVAAFYWGKNFDVFVIPAMRMVVDFGLEEPAFLITVPGESGNPSSEHYDDMIPYYLEGKNHPLPFKDAAVKAQYGRTLLLLPGGAKVTGKPVD
jgi:acyl-homoserine-lactone acylase